VITELASSLARWSA